MRVVFVVPVLNLSGGIRVIARYAKALCDRGHQVTVVSTGPKPPSTRERVRALVKERQWLRTASIEPSHFDGLDIEVRRLARWRAVTDRDVPDADVIVATWWRTAEWVWRLSPAKGAKVYFLQGYESWGGPPDRVDATWRLPMHRIAVSRWIEEIGQSRFGITRMSHVPNGVDTDQFDSPPRSKQPVPTVGVIYSGAPLKAYEVALEAIRLARHRIPNLRVRAFGAEEPTARLPLPADAVFALRPPQDRIRDIYAGCDAWLFSSRQEGFGLPVLEALACRTPVIASPAGAAPEILAEGGGMLLPGADPAAMASAIESICTLSSAAWRALSDRAREVALGHRWEESGRRFEAALEAAVASEISRAGYACSPRG